MTARWYVLQSKVHKEEVLWQRLRAKGYEVFYPRLFVYYKKTRSIKIKPYFPGYLFIRVNLEEVRPSSFQWMPDAVGLVGFEEKPAWVPDHFFRAVQEHLQEAAALGERLLVGFDEGEPPSRKGGLHSHFPAIFDSRLSGKDRVQALYQLLRDESSKSVDTTAEAFS